MSKNKLKTYSLSVETIKMIDEMVDKYHTSKSWIISVAIFDLWTNKVGKLKDGEEDVIGKK